MLHRRVASSREVEIFSGLLAFDNYVPSQNYGGWFANERERERESCEAVFSSLGAFVLRGQENSAGKIIFLPHSTSLLYTAARLKTTPLFFSHRLHRFPSRFPLLALCPYLFAIESRIYPTACRIFLALLSSSPFRRISFAVPLFPGTSIDCCSLLALMFHHPYAFTVTHPSIALAFSSM